MEGRKRRAAAADRHDDDDGAVGPGVTRRTMTTTTLFHRHLHQHGCGGGQRSASAAAAAAPALPGFAFQVQRPGRVDLRALNRLDVERVAAEADVDALQHHLENLAFASLSEEDLATHSDQAVVKAFRLAQLTIEYLLHAQDSLAEQLDRMAAESVRRIQRAAHLKSAVCKRDKAIALLKKHLQQQRRCISMATEAEAEAILPGSGAAAAAGVTRTSKLRLYVTLPDGACAGVLASPLMPLHELKRQVLPDLLSALPDTHASSTAAAAFGEQDFRLAHRGVRLADDKTLRELRLPDEASLVCILTPSTSGGPAAATAATATAGRRTQQQRRESDGVQEKQGEREKADEERWLAKQERAVSAIERRLADFEGHVLSFLERQRAELAAETGRLWERLPHAEAQGKEEAQATAFAPPSTSARRPASQSISPLRRSTGQQQQQQLSSSVSPSSSSSKPRRQRPQQPQPSLAGHRPMMGELDIEARVRALLGAVEARVRAKVRRKRVVGSADLEQIKELQSLLQAELLQLEKEKGTGIKQLNQEDAGELQERVARLEARRSSLPQHVQALLAKVQAHVAAAVEGGGGDEEEAAAGQKEQEQEAAAAASLSSSSGGACSDRQPSAAPHRLAPSKPPKQRSRPTATAPPPQAAPAPHSLPRSFPTVEQSTRNDDYESGSIISEEEEEQERRGLHDEASIFSLRSAALPPSNAGGSTASPASPAAASQPAVEGEEEGSEVEEVWTEAEEEKEKEQQQQQQLQQQQRRHFDDEEEGSLVTIEEEEGLE